MPINSDWTALTLSNVNTELEREGVYELSEHLPRLMPDTIYVGSSANIRERLRDHVNTTDLCLKDATHYRVEYTRDYKRREQELYDAHVKLYGRPPRCNDVRPPGR